MCTSSCINKISESKNDSFNDEIIKQEVSYNFWEGSNNISVLKRYEMSVRIAEAMDIMFDELARLEVNHCKLLLEWSKKVLQYVEKIRNDEDIKFAFYGTNKRSCIQVFNAIVLLNKCKTRNFIEQTQSWLTIFEKLHHNILNKRVDAVVKEFQDSVKQYTEAVSAYKKARSSYVEYATSIRPEFVIGQNLSMFDEIDEIKKKKLNQFLKNYEEKKEYFSLMLPGCTAVILKTVNQFNEIEEERLRMLKSIFECINQAYSIEIDKKYYEVIEGLQKSVDNLDIEKDIKYWSQTYGPDIDFDHFQFNNSLSYLPQNNVKSSSHKLENSQKRSIEDNEINSYY